MKTITLNSNGYIEASVHEISAQEMRSISGGSFAEDIGYAFGMATGYFLAAGPRIGLQAAAFLRLIK